MSDNNKLIQWESLPIEIAIDIFLRLPIKSIIICTSVSKSWKSQIQNPTFISTHLHHSHNKNKNLLLFSLYSHTHKESYALQNEDEPHFTQHSSLITLSMFHSFSLQTEHSVWWGFAQPEVEVYSLSTVEWRTVVTGLALICAARRCESQAFVNGAMHWVACRVHDDGFQRFVLVFDLGDEVFREILLPPELPDTCELPFISGIRKNGDVVFILRESKEFKDLRIIGYENTFVHSFVESLVLLDKAANSAVIY
uniref:F-box domain-containing protein n=1 Tax=Quercus lobata TaxID=97700 RepID=A0A7N2R7C1_QUELO